MTHLGDGPSSESNDEVASTPRHAPAARPGSASAHSVRRAGPRVARAARPARSEAERIRRSRLTQQRGSAALRRPGTAAPREFFVIFTTALSVVEWRDAPQHRLAVVAADWVVADVHPVGRLALERRAQVLGRVVDARVSAVRPGDAAP